MRKVYKVILQIISGAVMILLGLLVGLKVAQQDIQQDMQRSTVKTIAIVNMDEGVMVGEERTYYAEQMLTCPDVDYEVTDLHDAMSGVDDGKYAAYIIIPANFSENICSINGEPSRAELEYAVNTNLRDDVNEQVHRRITTFENTLMNNIEYMYLSAVLQEFHNAQNSAEIIMQNDTEDMEILMEVQPGDISKEVDLENGEEVPYDIDFLDLTSYYDSNAELIEDINDYYSQAQTKGDEAYQEIARTGDQVSEDVDRINVVMEGIDIFVDEEGNDLLAKAQENIENAITETERNNQEVTEQITELAESVQLPTMLYEDGEIAAVIQTLQDSLDIEVENGDYEDPLLSEEDEEGEEEENEEDGEEENFQIPLIDVEDQPFTVVRSAEINQLRMQQAVLYQLLQKPEQYETVSYDEVVESINSNLMEPVAANQEQALADIGAAQDSFMDSSTEYLTQMSEYSILDYLDLDGIYGKMDQFDTNIGEMYEEIAKQDEQYNEYVDNVYSATEEWKEMWKADIEAADEASLAKLDTGLAAAKDSRENSNTTNLGLLDELTKKLPYTRLGSLEYTSAYQFMVSPVTFTDKGGEHRYTYVSETRDYDKYIMICIVVLPVLIITMALVHGWEDRKNMGRGEQWNAYE
ncbi:MAG: YhgE/Pip domain-containing protein [Lachnospiraceae bacterium]